MKIPEYNEDPYPWYEYMRKNNPIYRIGNTVNVFNYKDITEILGNYKIYSSQFRDLLGSDISSMLNQKISTPIIILDPPGHTKLRNIVSNEFNQSSITLNEGKIRKTAVKLINEIDAPDNFDAVKNLSFPLPVNVITEMLGLPEQDRQQFKVWSDKIATSLGRGPDMETDFEMADYFKNLINSGQSSGLIKELKESSIDGEMLTDQEISSFAILLLVAGNETTTNLITNSFIALAENPQWQATALKNKDIIPGIIEESLRYYSPVQSTRRYAKENTSFHGIDIEKGDFLNLYIGSANRDPELFVDPNIFNPERKPNRHIAFGYGIHFCLGSPLARLEGRIILEEFFKKYKNFSIERPDNNDRIESDIMYGYNKLMIHAH